MNVLLRTACGARQILDVPRINREIEVPLKVTIPFAVPSGHPLDAEIKTRKFRFVTTVTDLCGFEAIYEEAQP